MEAESLDSKISGSDSFLEPEDSGDESRVKFTVLGVCLAAIISCFLMSFFVVLAHYLHRKLRWRSGQHPSSNDPSQPQLDEKQLKRKRYYSIENWLVNKKVEDHDDLCDLVSGREVKSPSDAKLRSRTCSMDTFPIDEEWASSSCDDDDEEENCRECPICMEAMHIGDIVSWSPNPSCGHVFHHRCIKEWLLKRTDCPFCRKCFLPIDDVRATRPMAQIAELISAQKQRSAPCYYCVQHGIVNIPRRAEYLITDADNLNIVRERAASIPDREELIQLRGHHCNEENEYQYGSNGYGYPYPLFVHSEDGEESNDDTGGSHPGASPRTSEGEDEGNEV